LTFQWSLKDNPSKLTSIKNTDKRKQIGLRCVSQKLFLERMSLSLSLLLRMQPNEARQHGIGGATSGTPPLTFCAIKRA